jgi:hypothetical protein
MLKIIRINNVFVILRNAHLLHCVGLAIKIQQWRYGALRHGLRTKPTYRPF